MTPANESYTHTQRNLPVRGFRPMYYLLAMGLISGYGLYKVGRGNREQVYVYLSTLSIYLKHSFPTATRKEDTHTGLNIDNNDTDVG